VLSPVPRLGVHLALGGGLRKAAERAGAIGATAVQVFADNPTAWRRRAAPPTHLDTFRTRLAELDIDPVAIHASYLVNLAGPDPRFREDSIAVLASELSAARRFGARFVNVHTGSHRDTSIAEGMARVADGVVAALARSDEAAAGERPSDESSPGEARVADPPVLVLENASGGGWSIGTTVEELAEIAEAAAARGVPESRLAFCLDTAHAWGAGYGIDDPGAIDSLIATIDRELGLERLPLIHLNDSRSERGSRRDWHEHIGGGRIGELGLGHVVRHEALRRAAFILETPGMLEGYDAINLSRVRALFAGERLEPLPPEAFQLPPGRTRKAAPPSEPEA